MRGPQAVRKNEIFTFSKNTVFLIFVIFLSYSPVRHRVGGGGSGPNRSLKQKKRSLKENLESVSNFEASCPQGEGKMGFP